MPQPKLKQRLTYKQLLYRLQQWWANHFTLQLEIKIDENTYKLIYICSIRGISCTYNAFFLYNTPTNNRQSINNPSYHVYLKLQTGLNIRMNKKVFFTFMPLLSLPSRISVAHLVMHNVSTLRIHGSSLHTEIDNDKPTGWTTDLRQMDKEKQADIIFTWGHKHKTGRLRHLYNVFATHTVYV